jgi:hypothetical protein
MIQSISRCFGAFIRFTMLSFLAVAGAGCQPAQNFFMKEKITEKNAAARPGIHVDRFVFGKPYGAVDILFVVDNTRTFDPGLEQFQASYRDLIERFKADEAHQLDYRIQTVTTPGHRTPKNFVSKDQGSDLHLKELFGKEGEKAESPPILALTSSREPGAMDPVGSTTAGLMHEGFQGRERTPIFIVYALGDDMSADAVASGLAVPPVAPGLPGAAGAAAASSSSASGIAQPEIQKQLDRNRGFYQTHRLTLTRKSNGGGFKRCHHFIPADRALTFFQQFPFRSAQTLDLCDKDWESYPAKLFQSVIDFKKRLVLSREPKDPESMTLRAGAHLYRYGDEYRYDAETHEIVFLGDSGLQQGDLLEVSYFLEHKEEPLSGSPNPPGTPEERKE